MKDNPDVVILIVTFILAQIGIFLDQRRRSNKTDRKIDDVGADAGTAAAEATTAAERSEPTANGFAGKVLTALTQIGNDITEIRHRMDRFERHIDDHASADVRRPN